MTLEQYKTKIDKLYEIEKFRKYNILFNYKHLSEEEINKSEVQELDYDINDKHNWISFNWRENVRSGYFR